MIVVGVDPGLAHLGWCVIDGPKSPSVLDCGHWKSSSKEPLHCRLRNLGALMKEIGENHQPDRLALEWGAFHVSARQSLLVGTAIGTVISSFPQDLPTVYLAPNQVKLAVTGYGKAPKDQVAFLLSQQLKMPKDLSNHVSDAAAIAFTGLHSDA